MNAGSSAAPAGNNSMRDASSSGGTLCWLYFVVFASEAEASAATSLFESLESSARMFLP